MANLLFFHHQGFSPQFLSCATSDPSENGIRCILWNCISEWHGGPKKIAEISNCWPQHLHNGIAALAKQLVTVDRRLEDVDVEKVKDHEGKLRKTSYEYRLTDEIRKAEKLVGNLMQAMSKEGLRLGEIENLIRRHTRPLEDTEGAGWQLDKDKDASWFAKHLLHQGVLQREGANRYICPIPSFRTYLMKEAGMLVDKEQSGPALLEDSRSDGSFDVLKATDESRARRLQRSTNVSAEPIIPEPE